MIASEDMMSLYREVFFTRQGMVVLANLLNYLKFFQQAGPEDADKRNTAIYILTMCGVLVLPTEENDGTLLNVVESLSKVNGIYQMSQIENNSREDSL